MRLRNTVKALTHTAVSTAVKATLHPIDTTFEAVGLVKETAGARFGLVRNRISPAAQHEQAAAEDRPKHESAYPQTTGDVAHEVKEAADDATEAAVDAAKAVAAKAADQARVVKDETADKADKAKSPLQNKEAESPKEAAKKPKAEKPVAKRVPGQRVTTEQAATRKPAAKPVKQDPRDQIPGPDLAPYIPPAIDELPEPIVIVAE
jgi:hypothetical protein